MGWYCTCEFCGQTGKYGYECTCHRDRMVHLIKSLEGTVIIETIIRMCEDGSYYIHYHRPDGSDIFVEHVVHADLEYEGTIPGPVEISKDLFEKIKHMKPGEKLRG